MANPQSSNQNGIAPHFHQQGYPQPGPGSGVYQPQPNISKPFTLGEALPYTPFTSVFPFEPDIIRNPTIGSGPLAPSLAGLVSREDYDALNKEAEISSHSKRVEGSLEFVQHLLKTDKITHFQFKTSPIATLPLNKPTKSVADGISPFAKLIYDNTSISFRYSNTETTDASTPNGHGHSYGQGHGHGMSPRISKKSSPKARRQEPPKVVKHNPATSNAQAVAHNKSRIEIHLPTRKELNTAAAIYTPPRPPAPSSPIAAQIQAQTVSLADLMVTPKPPTLPVSQPSQVLPSPAPKVEPETPTPQAIIPKTELSDAPQQLSHVPEQDQPPPSSASSLKHVAIQIELPAASFDKNEFAVVPDAPELPAHLSAKRKRAAQDEFEDALGGELNQRELANAAFGDLRRCFQEIFSADDYLSNERGATSHLITLTNDQEPTMTIAAHDKAHKQINRVISLGCFRQAPLHDLLRIQTLSEGSLKQTESLDFKLDEAWGETDIGFWAQQLNGIEMGLKAARTSFRIMCGGREERQLYSEDLIQQGLNLFRNVISDIIIPTAELRSTGPTSNIFRLLTIHKKVIGTLFTTCQKVFSLMSDLIVSIDLSETVVHTLEFVASRLIFVENAHTERDSVVGVQKFDALRLVAMNVLSQIFLMNPAQREGIFNEILTSLEKLPIGKQSARQFKLSEGKSIQPVSALIMRLIQASAGKVDDRKEKLRGRMMQSLAEDDGSGGHTLSDGVNGKAEPTYAIKTETNAAVQHSTAIQELQALAKTLADGAYRNATYVVNFIVKRALKSTKSGDTPYRNLLDLFIEDFTTCLDSPDWPAAELLLRLTMYMMFQQVDGDKNAAPARNMALELLGVMAAAISRLRSYVRKTATNFEGSDSDELGRWLADLTLNVLEGNMSTEKTISWLGPYRVVLEHLQDRLGDDPYLKGAISYLITDWGSQVSLGYDSVANEEPEERDSELGRIAFRLRNMIDDPKWLSREYSFKSVVPSHAKLSHSTILLRSNFCASFKNILNILMGSMTTDQATVRSRSLKSINLVLDTDPTILDGDSVFIQLILQCSNDSSPQVRDSALGLIGKCMAMRPRLEEKMTPTVIQRFIDSGIGVRKRAMKLAKDIYLGNESKVVRSTIANGLLHRTQDPDEGVRELARQMIEEVWISPFYKEDDSVAFKQALTDHVALMVQTVKQGNTALVLDKVFQTILSPDYKLAEANSRVCTRLVADLVDLIGNPESDDPSIPSSRDAFQVLMIFAKADPKLFTFEQIRQLQPHIASVSTSEDLTVSRAVVVIYRRVLPQVSSVHSNFLVEVQRSLMPATSKVTRALLDDVVACVWIISELLETFKPPTHLVLSCLKNIQLMSGKGPLDRTKIRQFDRYSLIVGMIGKHCSLDSQEEHFKSKPNLPKWKGSVSKLMVDVLVPFANPSRPVDVRRPALDAIGLICQSNPRNYVSANVYTTFQQAFDERMPVLESMILRSFKEFLLIEEQRSEQAAAGKESVKRDLKVMGGTSFDDVASATTQRFLKDITRITLATHDDHAFLAMEVLASINRQGLVHPKETGVTLITLETCPVPKISELAYHEHRALHEKYESVLEREYAKAIQSAFQYQRDIIKDPRGATEHPFMSKLHLLTEVLKISKSKNRVRFLEKLVGQIDFDLSKLPAGQALSSHVQFSRFIIENIAFFEFVTIGELQTTVITMEKMVTGTGSSIAQAIESEIFHVRMDPISISQQIVSGEEQPIAPAPPTVDPQRLHQLAAGSVILLALWEVRTYLRRLYGLSSSRRESKGKSAPKDLAKSPVKVQGVTGDKFWDDVSRIMSAFDTPEHMIEQCRAFVELLNVDNEVKVPEEEDEFDLDGEAASPDGDDDEDAADHDPRGRKRKAGNAPGGRKKRARSNSKPRPRGRPKKQSTEAMEAGADVDMEWI
ncbi:ARM repeat-containing protein [Annulohypoxylon maeteangense]|uniref:ARM repeat-containing protein n=1 Tax=Annulohypoxylon maeteangense TaxID=1927788 RepID=UPI0020081506|nr:ARM repeat-containing protein [Annulohypoxylon maeteangense]KAI0890342.1 ARM repeat-containing protein [Annulohypoxylon maeteangense]